MSNESQYLRKLGRFDLNVGPLAHIPGDVRAVWGGLTFDAIQAMRALSIPSRWPTLADGQDPRRVRDSLERNRLAWGMKHTIPAMWGAILRHSMDPVFGGPPCLDEIHVGVIAVIRSAADAGAITSYWRHELITINSGAYSAALAFADEHNNVAYVDGTMTEQPGYSAVAPLLTARGIDPRIGDNYQRFAPSRVEWRNRPGYPVRRDLLHEREGTIEPRYWVPVREAVSAHDTERNIAVRHLCYAMAFAK